MSGISGTFADAIIDVLRGTTLTGLSGLYAKVHTGEPGADGTANPSAVTTRNAVVLAAPVAGSGSASLASVGDFTMTTTEDITHVSLWETVGPAGGLFVGSGPLSATKYVNNQDLLHFDSLVVSVGPPAA